jgi:hypothetical protein
MITQKYPSTFSNTNLYAFVNSPTCAKHLGHLIIRGLIIVIINDVKILCVKST